MTAICGGNPSQVQAGVQADLVYAAGAAAILNAAGGAPWLGAAAAVLGVLSFQSAVLCAVDPPAVPTFTGADIVALLTADPTQAGKTARQKVIDTVSNILWYQVCQCTIVVTPPPPAPPTQPADYPTYGPPPPATGVPCASHSYTSVNIPFATQLLDFWSPPIAVGAGTLVHGTIVNQIITAPGQNIGLNVWFGHPGLSFKDGVWQRVQSPGGDGLPPGTTYDFLLQVPPISNQLRFQYAGTDNNAGVGKVVTTWDMFCGGQGPGGPVVTCCQADPQTLTTLQQILTIAQLIQRQNAPFGYVAGTSHTGLSGMGQFAIQGLLGLVVTITSGLGSIGTEEGDPLVVFGGGWINVGTMDGFVTRERINATPCLIFPRDMGAQTLVGYSLPPGVVVTIQELKREA